MIKSQEPLPAGLDQAIDKAFNEIMSHLNPNEHGNAY